MRLLHIGTLRFISVGEDDRPKYVILSHRWVEDQEVTYQDVRDGQNTDLSGYKKIVQFAAYVNKYWPEVSYLWVDTCCINKKNDVELSESLNSMFDWYRNAESCIAYLADVEAVDEKTQFEQSEWFQRGWTLQELLAPRTVVFVTRTWDIIGIKGGFTQGHGWIDGGSAFEADLARITEIPEQVLHDYNTCNEWIPEHKIRWMERRTTTRAEDMWYALFGLFGVTPGASYGEGHQGAEQRFWTALKHKQGAENFLHRMGAWLSAPDAWTDYRVTRQQHPESDNWLIQSQPYVDWMATSTGLLWMHGKAGCGKTVLCSTAIEDVKTYCGGRPNAGYAVFYFTFSDIQKQQLVDLLRSLVAQLGWKGPGLLLLQQAHERPNRSSLGLDELKEILTSCFDAYDEVFLLLDALDECPENNDNRHNLFQWLECVLRGRRHIKIFATSRDLPDIKSAMTGLHARVLPIATESVNDPVRRDVLAELEDDSRLSRFDKETKEMIENVTTTKSDGMFRWVHCQLQELKKVRSIKPSFLRRSLMSSPQSLDETYERILSAIPEESGRDALAMLRLLAFSMSPPTLAEVAEITIIDSAGIGRVDLEDRPGLEDALEILSGLVVAYHHNGSPRSLRTVDVADTRVRLVHYSVKEYLESERILLSSASAFHLEKGRDHRILTHSCLAYLHHYTNSDEKLSTDKDLQAFPLLQYAAKSWFYHSALQQPAEVSREIRFLSDQSVVQDWLGITGVADCVCEYEPGSRPPGSALYYSSLLGLENIVGEVLWSKADPNASGGYFDNALQAACSRGYQRVVQMLLYAGADVNAQGGEYGNALQAACYNSDEQVVQMLLHAGADVNAQGGKYSNALQAACYNSDMRVVQMLLDADAGVNAHGGKYGSALQAACYNSNEQVVQMLLDAGADVNAQGGEHGNALQAACHYSNEQLVQMLLDAGANVDAPNGHDAAALQAASSKGHQRIVRMLLDAGANVHAQGSASTTALQAACLNDNEQVVQMLLDADADANDIGGRYDSLLHAACSRGQKQIARMLLDAGANVYSQDDVGNSRSTLEVASEAGHSEIVRMLLDARVDVDLEADVENRRSALQAASGAGHTEIVRMLLHSGAATNAQTDNRNLFAYGNALDHALDIATYERSRWLGALSGLSDRQFYGRPIGAHVSVQDRAAKAAVYRSIIEMLTTAVAVSTKAKASDEQGLDDSNRLIDQDEAGDDLNSQRHRDRR